MILTTILCDVCAAEITEPNGYEIKGQLPRFNRGCIEDKPVIDMSDICEPCAKQLYKGLEELKKQIKTDFHPQKHSVL